MRSMVLPYRMHETREENQQSVRGALTQIYYETRRVEVGGLAGALSGLKLEENDYSQHN